MNIFGKQHKDNFTEMHILLKSDHLSKNIFEANTKKNAFAKIAEDLSRICLCKDRRGFIADLSLQRSPMIYRGFVFAKIAEDLSRICLCKNCRGFIADLSLQRLPMIYRGFDKLFIM